MSSYQKQYYEILKKLVNNPLKKTDSRVGQTQSNFVEMMRVNLQKEFPLMEVKKIQFSNVLHELLWFISGDTNIKYLYDNKCNIWNDDAYRYYKENVSKQPNERLFNDDILSKEDFLKHVKAGTNGFGNMDKIYGYNWRKFNGKTDQLKNIINKLKKDPNNRRLIVSAHNPTDLENGNVGLPSCHNFFQFYTVPIPLRERLKYRPDVITTADIDVKNIDLEKVLDNNNVPKYYLNLWYNLRSQDYFLGNPYNVPSYSILNYIVGNMVNMVPNEIVTTMIDCHLYTEHLDAADEWMRRYEESEADDSEMYCKSKLYINKKIKSLDDIKFEDFTLTNYEPLSYIKTKLLT
ncbi:MAG: thymidylate synthase [bacterium]